MRRWMESQGTPSAILEALNFEQAESEDQFSSDVSEEWPTEPPARIGSVRAIYDTDQCTPCEHCHLALIPTMQPADAPAYLRFGSFNSCPPPEIHVAFMRDWGRRFRAVPICVTHDTIECEVLFPPQTPADARLLANEQYHYCSEIFGDGGDSPERLALALWKAPYWSFWWD